MLQGLAVEQNPMLKEMQTSGKKPEIVYEDQWLLELNKPTGMLSVPGKKDGSSIYSLIRKQYPNADGPVMVHRLDMATSGLLLIATSKQIPQPLQEQFKNRLIKKRYIALLDGVVQADQGTIELPLCLNPFERPLQMVHTQYGKSAITDFEVLERTERQTRIAFYPQTGRTHQLRVHAAHPLGLNCPIIGDELYGKKAERLYLHAEVLDFIHPVTGDRMKIIQEAEF